jgi:hypothetical protein
MQVNELDRTMSTEEYNAVEKVLLGSYKVDTTAEEVPLEWATMKADNLLVRSLKDVVGLYAHTVKKEVENLEKNVHQARKVFNGR